MSKYSSRGSKWDATRKRVLARDNHTCGYCGREADTVDHYIAKANGGTDDESNLIASCNQCNARKGAKVLIRVAYVNRRWLDYV